MSQVTAPRLAALEILRATRDGDLADRALERHGRGLPRDFGWLQELIYGTFRLRGRIDFILAGRVRGGLSSLDADVLDILRLGVYQLLEMGSVPAYAAVSQSVELTRAAGHARASGLVNGVLQAIVRGSGAISFPDPDSQPVEWLSSWGSHPRWLVERWLERWGFDETAALVEANNSRPELYIRPVGVSREEAVRRLAVAGIETTDVPLSPDSVRVGSSAGPVETLGLVPGVIQDPAATLVVRFAAVPEGSTVLDLCAAPGGKAVGLATTAGYVAAADLSVRRLRRLSENVERLGMESRVGAVAADARVPPFKPADAVLLDAPCTGTGTLRRHPDGRWRLDPEQIGMLCHLQDELLTAAAGCVRAGGLLVYSTCSLEREENEDRVEGFLAAHPEFAREPMSGLVDVKLLNERGDLSVLPQRSETDGAYASRLRRAR